MKQKWEEHQEDHPDTANIVQQGLDKLADYQNRVDDVPAYVLAMGNFTLNFRFCTIGLYQKHQIPLVVNPSIKLRWYENFRPHEFAGVKRLVLHEVCESTV